MPIRCFNVVSLPLDAFLFLVLLCNSDDHKKRKTDTECVNEAKTILYRELRYQRRKDESKL